MMMVFWDVAPFRLEEVYQNSEVPAASIIRVIAWDVKFHPFLN
jgi:hypothetical protein